MRAPRGATCGRSRQRSFSTISGPSCCRRVLTLPRRRRAKDTCASCFCARSASRFVVLARLGGSLAFQWRQRCATGDAVVVRYADGTKNVKTLWREAEKLTGEDGALQMVDPLHVIETVMRYFYSLAQVGLQHLR
jgi:hypothetical protein